MRPGVAKFLLRLLLAVATVWAIYLLRANLWFRWYPAVMVTAALSGFAISLFRTPLVEVFARRWGERLDPKGIAYCRRVTVAWTVFLAAHLALTVTTVFASYEVWALYNGAIAYVLMGLMFLAEWCIRRRTRHG